MSGRAGARRSGREAALQMLFQMEASEASADETIALFWRSFEAEPEGKSYADELVRGVAEARAEIDAAL
jgi:N utilization substance protein B